MRSMSTTKERDIKMKDKSRRSPLLSRKTEIEQQRKSANLPSTSNRKKVVASMESKKVPIYSKPTISSILYARNPMKQPSFDKTKHVPQSKVMSTKSKFNEKNVTTSYMKIVGSRKPKDVGKPLSPLKFNNVNGKKQMRQPTKGLERKIKVIEKKPRLFDVLSSSKDNYDVITHGEDKIIPIENENINLVLEDYNKQHLDHEEGDILSNELVYEDVANSTLCEHLIPIILEEDQDMVELDTSFQDNVTINESISIELIDDYGFVINQQDQAEEIFDCSNDHLDHHTEVNQGIVELENKHVVQEVDHGSKDVESGESKDLEHEEMEGEKLGPEEPKPKEVEIIEGKEKVPKEEDQTSRVLVNNGKLVAHGKKDTAAYNYVIEDTVSKLREQKRNRVKALVGAFETVISLEYDILQKTIISHQ